MSSFNVYTEMPSIPFKIIRYLVENNDDIFKLLKYDTMDALTKDPLSIDEKLDLLYTDQDSEDGYRVFLKPLVDDAIPNACSQLRLYKVSMSPEDNLNGVVCYEFDIICGAKISHVYDREGIPCSRIDLIEMELLKMLNGYDEFGFGYLQFNKELSRSCTERLAISNSKTFFGGSLVMAVAIMNTIDECE